MLGYFIQCDEEYGARLKRGIEQGVQNADNEHGGPMGATNPGAVVRQAEEDGHAAEPYSY